VGLIGFSTKLSGARSGTSLGTADTRLRAVGRILLCLAIFGVAIQAWSQQTSPVTTEDKVLSGTGKDAAQNAAPSTPAQHAAGSIHGVVVGREGDVYEGANVELVQSGSDVPTQRSVASDSMGEFDFADVPSGAFELTISSNGFAPQVISGVLHPGENYEPKPVVLLPIAVKSEVRVTASEEEIAAEQLHEEEKQRVLGVIPNFYVTYVPNAPPLTSGQKFSLAWKSTVDPVTVLIGGMSAGIEQATNSFSGYGQGAQGYAKRFGANMSDNFIGTMIGSAMLPSLLKQDPRYFYKGTGTIRSRIFYAIANSVICKGDNGRWQMNYSAISGGLAAGAISNLYYPAANRSGVALSFENAAIGTAEGAVQNLVQEFIVRRFTPGIPNYGSSKP
jgi:hypothetical protein